MGGRHLIDLQRGGINSVDPALGRLKSLSARSLSLTGHFYFASYAQTAFGNASK